MKNLSCLFVLLVLAFSCRTEINSIELGQPRALGEQTFSNEKWGQFVYQHLKYYAVTVDPLSYVSADLRPTFKSQLDSLRKVKEFNYDLAFDKALASKKINANQSQAVRGFIKNLMDYMANRPDKKSVQDWFDQREKETKEREDLTYVEKDYILVVQSVFRYYLKNKTHDLIDESPNLNSGSNNRASADNLVKSVPGGRAMADNCNDLCPLNTIASFVGLGSALGGVFGAAVFALGGIAVLIADPNICSCTTDQCTYVRGISTPDVCYNAGNGLRFKTYGYGNPQPVDLTWYFYRDNLKATPDVIKSSGTSGLPYDEMVLTDAEIGGASQIAVKVLSNCNGNYLNSAHFGWYVPSNFGKPRFMIYNLDGYNPNTGVIGQNSYFGITGANYVPVTWSVSSMYATVLQNNQYGANFIVQWHSPAGTATVSASASTPCGSDTKYLSIQTH